MRWYPMNQTPENNGLFQFCFLSENFGGLLKYLIIQFKFKEELPAGSKLNLGYSSVVEFTLANNLVVPNPLVVTEDFFDGTSYNATLGDLLGVGYIDNYLFVYSDSTYPSSQNLSYYDVHIDPNKSEPQDINIFGDEYSSVVFQPYVSIRGGFVDGDTQRHNLNLITNGMTFCMNQLTDLVFDDGTSFIYNYGDIHFGSYNACFMFRKGSRLKIGDGATFNYGNYGLGILAMFPDSKLEFGEDATLIVDGRMMLMGYPEAPEKELHIELKPGQKLVFSERSRLMRVPWANAPVHLNVHMLGGELDDSNLRPEDRELIRRIYPEVKGSLKDNLAVSPNPNSGTFEVRITANEPGQAGFQLFTLDGKAAGAPIQIALEKGINPIPLSWSVAPGVYLLRVNTGKDIATKKILVQ